MKKTLKTLAAAVAAFGLAFAAEAADTISTWQGGASGIWENNANWDGSDYGHYQTIYNVNDEGAEITIGTAAISIRGIAVTKSFTLNGTNTAASLKFYDNVTPVVRVTDDSVLTIKGTVAFAPRQAGPTVAAPICVDDGATLTLTRHTEKTGGNGYVTFNGPITGSGTVNTIRAGNRIYGAQFAGDNSGFTGTFTLDSVNGYQYTQWKSVDSGSANAVWQLGAGTGDNFGINIADGGTIKFGELTGTCTLNNLAVDSSVTLELGGKNTDFTNGMNVCGMSVRKVGTGTMMWNGLNMSSLTVAGGSVVLAAGTDLDSLVLDGGTVDAVNLSSVTTFNVPVAVLTVANPGSLDLSTIPLTGTPDGYTAKRVATTDPTKVMIVMAKNTDYVWTGAGETTLWANSDNWIHPDGSAADESPTAGSTVIFPSTFSEGATVTFDADLSGEGFDFAINCDVTLSCKDMKQRVVYPKTFAGSGKLTLDNMRVQSLANKTLTIDNAIHVQGDSMLFSRAKDGHVVVEGPITGGAKLTVSDNNSLRNNTQFFGDLSGFTGTLDVDVNLLLRDDAALNLTGAVLNVDGLLTVNSECTESALKVGSVTGKGEIMNSTLKAMTLEFGALNATNETSALLTQNAGVDAWTIRKIGTGRQSFTNAAMTNNIELVAGGLKLPENIVVSNVTLTSGKFVFDYNANWELDTATNVMTLATSSRAITTDDIVIDNLPYGYYFTADNTTDATKLTITIKQNVFTWNNGAGDYLWSNTNNWTRSDGKPVTEKPAGEDAVSIGANQTVIVVQGQAFGPMEMGDGSKLAVIVTANCDFSLTLPSGFDTGKVSAMGPFDVTYDSGTDKFTATRVDETFTWIGNDGNWGDATNWSVRNFYTAVAPSANDKATFPDAADGTEVVIDADSQIDTIYFGNAAVAFSNEKSLVVDLTTNLENKVGTMILKGKVNLRCPSDQNSAYYVNLVVPEGETATIDEAKNTAKQITPYVYGSITGRGTLNLENASGNTWSGPFIYGDMSEFRGIVNVPNWKERNNTQLFDGDGDGWFYASNAVWNVSTSKAYKFLQANVNYSFGALNGTVWQGDYVYKRNYVKAGLIEVGALNVDCELTGGALYETPIRKIGTAKFRCGADEIGNVEIVSGSYESFNDTQKGYFTFSGGEFVVSTNITKDIDYAGKIKNSHSVIVVDVSTSNRVWSSAIDSSNDAGFTKKGDATLTLSASPLYSGLTTVADGKLMLKKGTVLNGALCVTGGTIGFNEALSDEEETLLSWTCDANIPEVTIDDFDVPTLTVPNAYVFTTNGTAVALNVVRTPASYSFRDDITGGNWVDSENWQVSDDAPAYYPSTNDNATIDANVIVTTEVGQVVKTLSMSDNAKLAFDLTDIAKNESVTIFEVGEGTSPLTTNNVILLYATNDYVLAVDTLTAAKKMSVTLYDKKTFVWSDAGDDNLFGNPSNWVYGVAGGPMAESIPDKYCTATFPVSFENGITVVLTQDVEVAKATFGCHVTMACDGGPYRLFPQGVDGSGKISLRNAGIGSVKYHQITVPNDIEILPSTDDDPWANYSTFKGYNQEYNLTLTGDITGSGWFLNGGYVYFSGDTSGFEGKLSTVADMKISADAALDWSKAYVLLGSKEMTVNATCTATTLKIGALGDTTGMIKNYTSNAMTLEIGGRNMDDAVGFATLSVDGEVGAWSIKKVGSGTQTLTKNPNCAVTVEEGFLILPNGSTLTSLSVDDSAKLVIAGNSSWAADTTNTLFTVSGATELPIAANKVVLKDVQGEVITETTASGVTYSVVVSVVAREHVWTGAGADNHWDNIRNWEGLAIPAATNGVAIFNSDATVFLPNGVNLSAIKIADGKALTLTGESGGSNNLFGNVTNVTGTGKLVLADVKLVAMAKITIYTDVEVPGGTTAILRNTTSKSFTLIDGELTGEGTLIGRSEQSSNTYSGLNLQGDGSKFAGVIEMYSSNKDEQRDSHSLLPCASSSNAVWRLYVDAEPKNIGDAPFKMANSTYYLGAIMYRMYTEGENTENNITYEIGALDQDSFIQTVVRSEKDRGGKFGSNNDINWIAPTATFTNDVKNVRALATLGGGTIVITSTNTLPTGRIRFAEKGGTLKTKIVDDVKIDPSALFTQCSAAICFDDEGEDYTWATAIADSNEDGLTKKGAGTLTLVEKPLYTGDTVVEAGKLVLTNGAVLFGDLAVTNGAKVGFISPVTDADKTLLAWNATYGNLHVKIGDFVVQGLPEGAALNLVVENNKAYLKVSSIYTWTGNANNNLWSDAGNWNVGEEVATAAPSVNDVAQITNANVTVVVSPNQSFGRLDFAADTKLRVLPTTGTEATSVFTLPTLSDGTRLSADRLEVCGPYGTEVDANGVVYATRVASTFTWVGADGDWSEIANWKVGDYPTAVLPADNDSTVFPASLNAVAVTMNTESKVSNVWADAQLTLKGPKILHNNFYYGTGKLILDGAQLYARLREDMVISNDIEVVSSSTNHIRLSSGRSGGSNYAYSCHTYGDITGTGTLQWSSDSRYPSGSWAGMHFHGDNTKFAGTFEQTEGFGGRSGMGSATCKASSQNAVWYANSQAKDNTDAPFVQNGSDTYYFGAIVGAIQGGYNNAKFEIGKRDDVDSVFTFVGRADGSGNQTGCYVTKVGSSLLTMKCGKQNGDPSKHLRGLTLKGGTTWVQYTPTEYLTFSGAGATLLMNTNGTDVADALLLDPSAVIKNSEVAICYDDQGTNATWATALAASNSGGFTKKGAGTLILAAAPLYSGETSVQEGRILMPADSAVTLADDTHSNLVTVAGTQMLELKKKVDNTVYGVVTNSGNWSTAISWKDKDGNEIAEPSDWSCTNANLVVPVGTYTLAFDVNRAFTNLTVSTAGSCTFTKADGVTVSAKVLDLAMAEDMVFGSTNLITITESPILGSTLKTIADIGHGKVVMTAPATYEPTVAVVVGGVAGAKLVNNGGSLFVYKPAPTVFTVTGITSTAQTNFNGSAVTIAYSKYAQGDYAVVTGKLTIAGHDYLFELPNDQPSGGTITVQVSNEDAAASNVVSAAVSVIGYGTVKGGDDSLTAYDNTAYLYQGAKVEGGAGTNAWFKTYATGSTLNEEGGAWTGTKPPVEDGKIVFGENSEFEYDDYEFAPDAAARTGEVTVVNMNITFEEVLDETANVYIDKQAALSVVLDGDVVRFAAVVDGAWTTNTEVEAFLDTEYQVRMTLDYRTMPATVTYEVATNGTYQTVATGHARADKSTFEGVKFNGAGKLAVMTGSNIVDSVDASLVADANGNKYADLNAALGNAGLTLLWDISWAPKTNDLAEFTVAANGHNLYFTPTDGVKVEKVDNEYRIIGNYYEVMNLLFGTDSVTTNKFMYFTNAVAQAADSAITNLYLLRDATIAETLAVNRNIWFNGETNILSGAGMAVEGGMTFTIEGGCIGIPSFDGAVLKGGRFSETSTNYWKDVAAAGGNTFAQLAFAEREDYVWQLIATNAAPKDGEILMPVKTAEGEAASVVVSNGWAKTVTELTDPEDQSAALSVVQSNGLTRLDNEILGLVDDKHEVTAIQIPVIQPVQATDTDKVTFQLGNVKQSAISASGARVKYRVWTGTTPGAKTTASATTNSTDTIKMDLPTKGVQYYLIEVDTGTVK